MLVTMMSVKQPQCDIACRPVSSVFVRLESQLMTDIQTILQLLQRQPTLGPPAYSTVTASPEYHKPAMKVQLVAMSSSHLFSHTGTQVRKSTVYKLHFTLHSLENVR